MNAMNPEFVAQMRERMGASKIDFLLWTKQTFLDLRI
jgi:hypothetical protein